MKKQIDLQIVYRDPKELVPYVNNARTHSDEQVRQIAASIKEFGFNDPVELDGDKGIISGHGRVQAALLLGLDRIPTVDLHGLSPAQKKAYILAANKIALNADWDRDLLKLDLEYLKTMGGA
jgi:ParB-like chromosome segregation protein Spo0J